MEKSTSLPKSVKIGPYKYALRVDDAAVLQRSDDSNDCINGYCDLDAHEIVFATRAQKPSSVLHEVLHAVFDQSGLNIRLGAEREEDVVQSLDHILWGVLRDNPNLVAFLTDRGGK